MSYVIKESLVFSQNEGINAGDFNEMQGIQNVSFADYFLLPQMNFHPDSYTYAYNDTASNFNAYTEGVQCCARAGADGYSVTNNAGTIYLLVNNTSSFANNPPNPDGYQPRCVFPINLTENCLSLASSNFPPDATNPRYATISLVVSSSVQNVTRDFADSYTGVVTAQTTPKYNQITVTPVVTLGTPASFPAVPAWAGIPWAAVYIPAGGSTLYADGDLTLINRTIVIPVSIPRGINRYVVSPFSGDSSVTGAVRTMVIPGTSFASNIATSSTGTAGWGIPASTYYLQNQGSTGDAVVGIPLPSNCTFNSATVNYYKAAAGTSNLALLSLSSSGASSTLVSTTLTTTAGNSSYTLIPTAFNPNSTTAIVINYSPSTVANSERIYSVSVSYSQSDRYTNFTPDYANNKLIYNGGGSKYNIIIPIHGGNKKLEQIKVRSTAVSSNFALGFSNSTSGPITTVLTNTQLNVFLQPDGKTYSFISGNSTPRLDSMWLNGAASPFSTTSLGNLYLVWVPQTTNAEFYGAEILVSG